MKLLKEYVEPTKLDFLVEDNGGEGCKKEKVYRIKGAFCTADLKNQNQRIYPLEMLSKSIDVYREDYIKRRRALGELSHPESPEVNFEKAAIIIESLDLVGKDGMGVARVLTDLPCGKIVASLMKENIQIAVSTRGIGELKEGIVHDYVLAAVDIVMNPSNVKSFVEAITESSEWILSEGRFIKEMEVASKNLRDKVDRKYRSSDNLKLLMDFLQDIQTRR